MTQPPPLPQETLQYATTAPMSAMRRKAARSAGSNGFGSVVFAAFFGLGFLVALETAMQHHLTLLSVVIAAALGLQALAHLGCCILYIVASLRIKQPEPVWENALAIAGIVHACIVAIFPVTFLVCVMMKGFGDPCTATSSIAGCLFDVGIMLSFVQMVVLVRKLQQLGQ